MKVSVCAAKMFAHQLKQHKEKESAVENLLKFEVKQHWRSYGEEGLQSTNSSTFLEVGGTGRSLKRQQGLRGAGGLTYSCYSATFTVATL